ncbi:unnamed protein product [Mytilus edulis]|uniref:B box-type domain-containing protein n=1 Tax=Mytilus edulis TaxID=6550 RepID=A0A8S3TGZ9_MYTED|nr:unnamed protein product [Mytilus edulis]
MSDLILCGPCGYADNHRKADKWCIVCEEELCTDCVTVHKSIKTTRNHRLISTDEFRQIKHISIHLTCKDHDKRLELYCKTHDVAVCLGCVPSHHKACSDVMPLDKAAENAKRSTALADLEDTLTIALQNLQQLINDRASALENLDEAKVDQAQIQLRVAEMRTIKNIRLKLKKRFEVNTKGFMTYLSGCTMLSNGNVLIANYWGRKVLMEYSEDGKPIRDIPCSNSPFDFTVIDSNRIAVTYGNSEEIWVHEDESLFDSRGITVDDHQNVFLSDGYSNLLTIIQHDGKASKTLLTKSDGLDKPSALHYSKDKRVLLLCNEKIVQHYTILNSGHSV